ncbi:3-keto-5-aminohexanoate cleavage protein [Frankia sp. CNm7]|uniref:3-keto-5-aminohexanoate cleavage protein n=1 Tax=Frankia nepalensis TaxID=1836974 RepID=A0A937UL53_9ACTN|nr:3-keto-5-aminohexanoate cleavage protein [Frankia nepalensis]MBL7502358.1 3-keto-5-aminohexanoate cleavage protein [Frankia nepalensis]MBL7516189.1 3-keto-5-aminohexanoate cleavage protein [Frankia nepalensis]MBL7522095.1 3-keto-5-aminohexanoate cleavage protein [Frankia nepalensis]MBL7625678.1 3-keto-5-aminohexanoate cleavage protein [Frankia nepalensis]
MSGDPVILEAAINGATSRDRNPCVPITPPEIATDALACIVAGAAIVHHHIDRFGCSEAEAAERYLEAWRPILRARPDALIYPTIHAAASPSYEHQVPLAESGLARIGIVDPGSVNLGGIDAEGVPVGSFVYDNSYDKIARAFKICSDCRLGPSMAIYEPGFLRTAVAWWRAGCLPAGSMVKLYFSTDQGYLGAPFGLPPTARALDVYLEILADCDVPWAVSVVGGDVVASEVARLALERGGHLHLGLEFYGGDRRPTNVELVTEAVQLCEEVGRPVATPDQAATILGLPRPRLDRQ